MASNNLPTTPTNQHGPGDATAIFQALQQGLSLQTPANQPRLAASTNVTPSTTMLSVHDIEHIVSTTIKSIKATLTPTPGPKKDDTYEILRLEQLACVGLSTKFDGKRETFPLWHKLLRAERPNAVWKDATYLSILGVPCDLLLQFTEIPISTLLTQVKDRWTDPEQIKNASILGTYEFKNRLFAKFLYNSITDNFKTTLLNRVGTQYANDGQLFYWHLCNHVHHTSISYKDDLKDEIRKITLDQDHQGDIASYVTDIRHRIELLMTIESTSTATHEDLIRPILLQLCACPIKRFQDYAFDLQELYIDGKEKFTCRRENTSATLHATARQPQTRD
jgi:hypothetical protein